MKRSLWFSLLAAALVLGSVTGAEAQRRGRLPDKSIGLGMALQAGGEIDFDWPARDDLDATIGLHLHWDKFVMQRPKRRATLGVSLGILARIISWQQDNFERRNMLIDLAFRPRFVVGFREFAFYLGPEVGPTLISLLNKDYRNDDRARPGVNVSFVALGFEWWWNPKYSLFTELGWAGHWIYHDRLDARLSQALISMGINFGR